MSPPSDFDCDVLIVGAGPVGCTLALELAARGVASIQIDQRERHDPAHPKCNTTSARSMEIFRRLGISQAVRQAGLPPDHPCDVVYATRYLQGEMGRLPIPAWSERHTGDAKAFDGGWPTPEPPHRISQLFLEPILRDAVDARPEVQARYGTSLTGLELLPLGAQATITTEGETRSIRARYVVGCDGGRSTVRRPLGVNMLGDAEMGSAKSVYMRAPSLNARRQHAPAWMTWIMNPERRGAVIAIDGRETWLVHCTLKPGETFETIDVGEAVAQVLGAKVPMDVLAIENWTSRRLVAERYRVGDVFLAGDAAHIWIPYAGFGMNAGIEDAAHLGWMLAAVLRGWGGRTLLDAYEAERRPVGELISHAAVELARTQRTVELPADLDAATPQAAQARRDVGQALVERDGPQFNPIGLNFGVCYEASPIVIEDGEAPPAFEIGGYTPSTVPGCRAPNVRLRDGRWLHDALGIDFTLVVSSPGVDTATLTSAARAATVPLEILDISAEPAAARLYSTALTLVRPDHRVAWRGDRAPADPARVVDRVRGAIADSQSVFWVNEGAL